MYSDRTIKPGPSPPLCWQIHRCLAVPMPTLRLWVRCPRASDGLFPLRLHLVGYVRWDARSNPVHLLLDNRYQQLQLYSSQRSINSEVAGRNKSERQDSPEIDRGGSSRFYPSMGKAESQGPLCECSGVLPEFVPPACNHRALWKQGRSVGFKPSL